MATYGTLADIRTELRVRLGLPDRGTSGDSRLNIAVNMALRQMWSEMPKSLLSEERRFLLEKPISEGTVSLDSSQPLVLTRTVASGETAWATDGTLIARTVEIKAGDLYYYRKIQDIHTSGSTNYLVMDKPHGLSTQSGVSYRIFTPEYPYAASVQKVLNVVRDPDTNPHPLVESVWSAELEGYRSSIGFRTEGIPEYYTRGDFFQLPSPNYTPEVGLKGNAETGSNAWGYNSLGAEQVTYGPAGTFSYRVIHVWGRWKDYEQTNEGKLLPFYQSAPSGATEKITTTWGNEGIEIRSPDLDYIHGYGNSSLAQTYRHYGVEKWIFRARHATEPAAGTNSDHRPHHMENDGIYYLWKISKGYTTSVLDRGDEDPVDKRVSLEPFHGHFHIRFDRQPSTEVPVLMRTFSRPPSLKYDTDSPRVPPECYDALYALTASYLVGDRDGAPDRKSLYYVEYKEHLSRLRKTYSVAGHQVGQFRNGISMRGSGTGPRRNTKITEIS